MNKKYKLFMSAIIALLIFGGGAWWWQSEGQYRNIEFVSGDPEVSSNKEYLRYYEALKQAYLEDQYGGETPEETLQLFIDALKAGDVELASKYFVVEKQVEILEELKIGKDNNTLSGFVKILEKEKISGYYKGSDTRFVFTTVDDNNVAEFSFDLILNSQTRRWKMYEL